MKTKFNVTGMTCASCSAHVEKSVSKLEGVQTVSVNLLSNSMAVEYDPEVTGEATICKAVAKAGYGASPEAEKETRSEHRRQRETPADQEHKDMRQRLVISVAFLIPLFYLSMGHMMGLPIPSFFHGEENALAFAFTQFLLCLPIAFVNLRYFTGGFKALWNRSPNMDSLIGIGSAAALIYGIWAIYQIGFGLGRNDMHLVHEYSMDLYFESAGMILTLITVGKYLETRAKGKTSQAIEKLIDLAPKTAMLVKEGGEEEEIPLEQVAAGDILAVRPGQSVPTDGVVTSGGTAVDESALTGESIPVEKQPGDAVTGGSINKTGYFQMRATKVGEDTALSQIIRLVEEASSSKAPISKLADRVSGVFVPIVIAIAILSTVVWLLVGQPFSFALSIGIAVLVVSCPCALGLATPTAIMVGTGKGAEHGILIKSAEALETAHSIHTVVLDKTGTITEGKPRVTDIVAPAQSKLLQIAASLEKGSEHPLAEAIVSEAQAQQVPLLNVQGFVSEAGKGVRGEIGGVSYLAGNQKLLLDHGVDPAPLLNAAQRLADEGKTPMYFAGNGKALGLIAAADVIKPTSLRAVKELEAMGVEVVMLTGDNERTAAAIQKQVGISRVVAQVLPQDKEKEVRSLQLSGKKVAMVGDGVNDAPALTAADVGVAIGAGTDIAIESADIVLMKSDLMDVAAAIQLSKSTLRNIKENLFWALFYNSIGIPLACGVFFTLWGWKLNPMFAAAAMSLSSVCVVLNALRLKLFRPKFRTSLTAAAGQQAMERLSYESIELPETDMKKREIAMNTKILKIEGMTCGHCSARVEQALNAIDGVSAVVNLEDKTAAVTLSKPVEDEVLVKAVSDAGYEVVGA